MRKSDEVLMTSGIYVRTPERKARGEWARKA